MSRVPLLLRSLQTTIDKSDKQFYPKIMKLWKEIALIALIVFPFALLADYIGWKDEIREASIIHGIPEEVLEIFYPYVPFGDFNPPE